MWTRYPATTPNPLDSRRVGYWVRRGQRGKVGSGQEEEQISWIRFQTWASPLLRQRGSPVRLHQQSRVGSWTHPKYWQMSLDHPHAVLPDHQHRHRLHLSLALARLRRTQRLYRHPADPCLNLRNQIDIPLPHSPQHSAHPAHSPLSRQRNDHMLLHRPWNFHPPDVRHIERARLKAVG